MAEAYGLSQLDGEFAHLSLERQDLEQWMSDKHLSANQLKADFSAMLQVLNEAKVEGREILSRRDWFTLSGVHGPPDYLLVSGGRRGRHPSGQNGWRVVEF
jgi:hypothetical protein